MFCFCSFFQRSSTMLEKEATRTLAQLYFWTEISPICASLFDGAECGIPISWFLVLPYQPFVTRCQSHLFRGESEFLVQRIRNFNTFIGWNVKRSCSQCLVFQRKLLNLFQKNFFSRLILVKGCWKFRQLIHLKRIGI